ncbi:HEL326Wp [Eremothecium sinecaudum]|uniref:HEL326Wp n=1 Tax=Eremothecium sinecaudum TaxID=45286 RepID=A0A120K2B0_9SACH|nr:HEL326Wp [Eremothecium sinecaudum]AMD20955.1 HEL326Wp [Eremothecium sinecaudum]
MSGKSNDELIASFSSDLSAFAFQANCAQKNFLDLYPLVATNDYNVNSSLVNRIEYDAMDLSVSEVKFLTWCCTSKDGPAAKVKRKNSGEEAVEDSKDECSLVNVFPHGKIVIFSPNGQNIVNIIQNKKELLGIYTTGSSIWILDEEKTVKHFTSTSPKPLKTFHLTDGKNEEIKNFQVLQFAQKTWLAVALEDAVYIIDPTKRRPTTVAKLEVFGCTSCRPLDEEHVIIADVEKVSVVNLKQNEVIQSWNIEAKRVAVIDQMVAVLDVEGTLSIFKTGSSKPVSRIQVENCEIIDFKETSTGNIILAWLNVNEPRFEIVTPKQISSTESIIITLPKAEVTQVSTQDLRPAQDSEDSVSGPTAPAKVTKSEQGKLNQQLIDALTGNVQNSTLIDIICIEKWSETNIKELIRTELSHDACNTLYNAIAEFLAKDVWHTNPRLHWWLNWLLILRSTHIEALNSHNKTTKRLKSSLKSCSEAFPVLLSIQGALEMLKAQAKLRHDLAQMTLKEQDPIATETMQENEVLYVNGEGDDFA